MEWDTKHFYITIKNCKFDKYALINFPIGHQTMIIITISSVC